jgi:hypothetical protein
LGIVNGSSRLAKRPALLVATLIVAAFVLGQPGPDAAQQVTIADSRRTVAAPADATPTPTANPSTPRPTSNAIYKGYTLEEIRADPELLEEVQSVADYLRPIHDKPDPPLPDVGSDTLCPNHVECP